MSSPSQGVDPRTPWKVASIVEVARVVLLSCTEPPCRQAKQRPLRCKRRTIVTSVASASFADIAVMTVPVLPDGLVVVVKRECATCVMVSPLLAAIPELTIYTQDDATFP